MTRKKQIIVPIVVLLTGIGLFGAFASMKKPPEEKPKVDNTPIVSVTPINVEPKQLSVDSYGVVMPKYETELVAQVSGQIVELSDVFVKGGFVRKDQVLAKIDASDYQAALIEADANLANAKAALEQEVAQGKVAEQEWKRITDTMPTELSLRKPQLAKELARVKAAQASVLRAQRNLERTEIKAPYDAMIESREIGLGAYVSTGRKIGKLLGTDIAEVRLPVADSQLEFLIDGGEQAKVILSGNYAGKKRTWQATIARSEGVIDANSRMSYLVAQIKDPYGLAHNDKPIRFGAYVTADILGMEVAAATAIPRYLVVDNKVAILDAEMKLRYVPVDIVRQEGPDVIISGGLHQGDQLITSALDYPVDGMQLALPKHLLDEESESAGDTQIASIKE
ncbi:efflux RND transporter periplasmic adaptor subunit [Thalassotalea sp. LPB0316]|uniref:efflux RND transporter periplasmic adaptor subunit n=1 Tax=Thalassotalea sp. LPB0316 TaxID=2769490 RepID=UPI00186802CD|nr:efflux RND transporter periplasmic adaptor subunit [Thalassotalea sp. LPB0316]QOL26034.1 efflux RND transporter periplasmic adaptor subunit [Thalassotalea sp. LPB0316]